MKSIEDDSSIMNRVDDLTALTTPASVSRMTSEEKQYLQLLALSQMGGVFSSGEFTPCQIPALLINQSGSTETTGINWLQPVAAKDHYDHFFDTTTSTESYRVGSSSSLPTRIRLYFVFILIHGVGEDVLVAGIESSLTGFARKSLYLVTSPKRFTVGHYQCQRYVCDL